MTSSAVASRKESHPSTSRPRLLLPPLTTMRDVLRPKHSSRSLSYAAVHTAVPDVCPVNSDTQGAGFVDKVLKELLIEPTRNYCLCPRACGWGSSTIFERHHERAHMKISSPACRKSRVVVSAALGCWTCSLLDEEMAHRNIPHLQILYTINRAQEYDGFCRVPQAQICQEPRGYISISGRVWHAPASSLLRSYRSGVYLG